MQHLTHPDLHEPVFLEWYGSEALLSAVCQLLHTKPEDLQLGNVAPNVEKVTTLLIPFTELFNLLINPQDSDFDLTWHRDAVPAETPADQEEDKLKIPHYGTQWNT